MIAPQRPPADLALPEGDAANDPAQGMNPAHFIVALSVLLAVTFAFGLGVGVLANGLIIRCAADVAAAHALRGINPEELP